MVSGIYECRIKVYLFWSYCHISRWQLRDPKVRKMKELLERTQSSYLPSFKNIERDVEAGKIGKANGFLVNMKLLPMSTMPQSRLPHQTQRTLFVLFSRSVDGGTGHHHVSETSWRSHWRLWGGGFSWAAPQARPTDARGLSDLE